MSIQCNLSTLMGKMRVTIQDISDSTGLARNTISSLYHDKVKRIDYDTLNKLCVFFNCQPGDIMEYVSDEEAVTE